MNFLKMNNKCPDFLMYYLKYARYVERMSDNTVNDLFIDIRTFVRYLQIKKYEKEYKNISLEEFRKLDINDISLNDVINVRSFTINDFIMFLRNFQGNSPSTRNCKLSSLKNFYEYLYRNNHIAINPVQNIKSAPVGKRNPKYLNLPESKTILSTAINDTQRQHIRNYAIICLFLNCCLRLSELVGINISDIKLDDETIKIKGKGNKDRIIYLNESAKEAVQEYLKIRPDIPKTNPDHKALFISERKKRISRRNVQNIVTQEIYKAFNDTKKEIHTHSLRHTGATLMYGECDISILVIKRILGHDNLSSTEIYTHVSNKKLQEIMENCSISSILEKMEDKNYGRE